MKFPDSFIDDLRDRVLPSVVIGRHLELKKDGSEFKALSPFNNEKTPSFTVIDQKRFWHDFSAGKSGDIFEFEMQHTGCDFPEAVKRIAEIAGVALPGDAGGHARRSDGGSRRDVGDDDRGDQRRDSPAASKKKRTIKATYDYTDAAGNVIYQVVRFEPKSFAQRRPAPEPGIWIWGLDVKDADGHPIEFMRKQPGRDWARYDKEKFENWHYTERATFPDLENVTHGLENYQEIAEELTLADDRRTFHIMEGEKDRRTMTEWGFLATTNSGGARHWGEHLAKLFADADVVLHQHNDVAGRERVALMAPMLLAVGARVRVCDPRVFWKDCPDKGDLTDWRDKGGGTAAQLYEIIDTPLLCPDWRPEPYRSKFGAVRWRDQSATDRPKYEWTISGLVPRKRTLLIFGESQSGKSFETFDIAMCVVRGIEFGGRRTRKGGVIYIAAEKGAGFINRMIAYRVHNNIADDADLPFAVLTRRINLWMDEKMVEEIAKECLALSAEWTVPLEAIVIDTHNAATSGASEIKSEDVTLIKDRYEELIERTGAGVWIVHHKNAQGGLRGSLILYNAIETAIELQVLQDKHTGDVKDDNGRPIRRASVKKQSEGQGGQHWDFVLRGDIPVGFRDDGSVETSCVTEAPARPETQEDKRDDKRADRSGAGFHLNKSEVSFFNAILKAIKKAGVPPPSALGLSSSVERVALWPDFTRAYREEVPNTEGDDDKAIERYKARVRKQIERARAALLNFKVIGVGQLAPTEEGKEGQHVIWPTGKPVWGQGMQWPAPKPKPKPAEPVIDAATGQPIDDLDGTF